MGGQSIARILALPRDVELDASKVRAFSIILRRGGLERQLGPNEYAALLYLCGARRVRQPRVSGDVERFVQHLIDQGFVIAVARPPDIAVSIDQRVALVEGLELEPAVYEVLGADNKPLHLVGAIGAALLEACDGRSTASGVQAALAAQGLRDTAMFDAELAHLQTAGLVEPVAPTGAPKSRGTVRRPADAVFAVPPESDLKFMLTADEAGVLARCWRMRPIRELVAECGIDEQWLLDLLARANGLGLVTVSHQRASAPVVLPPMVPEQQIAAEEEEDDGLGGDTVQAWGDAAPYADAMAMDIAPQVAPHAMTQAPMPIVQSAPRARTPGPVPVVQNARGHTPAPMPVVQPAPRNHTPAPMPVVHATPRNHTPGPMPRVHTPGPMPVVQAAEPRIHTPGPMPRVHTPGPIPVAVAPESSPLDVVPAPRHTPVPALPTPVAFAATSDAAAAKLASLASLSIQKEHIEVSAPARSSAKLPWILLVVFVIGGGTYHFITVQNLKAAVATAPAAGSAGSAGSTQPTESPAGVLASGYIAAKDPIMLSATTSGRLNQITVENGAAITKGQVLAVIDDGQIRAELSLAYAHVRDAKRALNRTKTLLKAQAATRLDLERAVGQVEIASAEARVINQKLEDTKIRSPIEGTVLEVIARVGEALNAGPGQGQIMKIADLKALVAEVDVDETEVKNLSLKQPADVILDAARGQFKGNVFEIAEQADRSRGTVLVRVEIEVGDAETVLKPGMAVQVRFLSKPRDAAPKPP